MLLPGPECVMGPCTASHCCCLHRHTLPCATFRSPHTAGGFHFVIGCWQITGLPLLLPGPVICHGPLYRLLMLLPGPECLMGPCTASHCLLSPSPHSAMCHFQVSSHCWWVPFC
ncbi:unnamed protein product, partial [Staurois parvus]